MEAQKLIHDEIVCKLCKVRKVNNSNETIIL
nr:MAG TPA: hypothetical protein [Caudoviricetes sp.]